MMAGTVLVVCDDAGVTQNTSALVEELGFRPKCVSDPGSALTELARSVPVAIVVHCATAQGTTTLPLAERLRSSRWAPRVIALISNPEDQHTNRAAELDIAIVDRSADTWEADLAALLDRQSLRPGALLAKTQPNPQARVRESR